MDLNERKILGGITASRATQQSNKWQAEKLSSKIDCHTRLRVLIVRASEGDWLTSSEQFSDTIELGGVVIL